MSIIEFVKTKLQHKELRYLISGGTSVVIEYISFLVLILFTPLLVASSISFIIGIAAGFVFHKLWSFAGKHQLKTHYQIVVYCIVAGFNFLATNILISVFVNGLGIIPAISKIITMSIIAVWTYVIFAVFIFKKSSDSDKN